MTPRGELSLGRLLWSGAVLLGLSAASLTTKTALFPDGPRPIDLGAHVMPGPEGSGDAEIAADVQKLARRKMSRKIVKIVVPPPPPPPKRPAPPLDKLVRLAGVMDFGGGEKPEAIIETKQTRKTKNYKVGDKLTPVPATIEEISEGVILAYDGKRWKLTYGGVVEISTTSQADSE